MATYSGKNLKVSVVVPCWNHGKYFYDCVMSLVRQTHENLEIIAINDGSTDNTEEVLHKLATEDKRIVTISTPNQGKANAVNMGINTAKGDIVSIQDADDLCLPERIERQVQCLIETRALVNYCDYTRFGVDEKPPMERLYYGTTDAFTCEQWNMNIEQGMSQMDAYFKVPDKAGGSSLFYKKIWADGMKFFPAQSKLRVQAVEDTDWGVRALFLLRRSSILMEKVYLYRIGSQNMDNIQRGL